MVFNFITFDPEDEYLNNHPGSPPYYYDPCPSFSSSDSSSAVGVCNGCLGGISSGLVLPVAESSDAGQQFSSPVQIPQSRNRSRDGNNFLLKLIHGRLRNRSDRGDGSKSLQDSQDRQGILKNGRDQGVASKLVLFGGYSRAIDLEDLLRASAEVLGKGLHWTTYKASLEDSTTVVVKRLKKNGNVTMTQLRKHMDLLGQLKHENVAPLRGYLISRDENLMLYDYYSQGSVHSMMQGEQRPSLSPEQRQKIVIGAVRGIAYIHKQNRGKLFHGNLTSSNVFINSQGYGCVSEICFNILKSRESSDLLYNNPNEEEASQATDIYGLGLLMLELLTPEKPWIANVEISTAYQDLMDDTFRLRYCRLPLKERTPMLNLALRCVTDMAGGRPKIKELVEQVENIKWDHE